jgi:hypothetical protein
MDLDTRCNQIFFYQLIAQGDSLWLQRDDSWRKTTGHGPTSLLNFEDFTAGHHEGPGAVFHAVALF